MPTTRRSASGPKATQGPTKGQSTISFANKVTKSIPKDTKKSILASRPAVANVEPDEEVEDVVVVEPELESAAEEEERPAVPEKSDAEIQAEKITDAKINQYWKVIEKQRIAPRVHQQDLNYSEKILRYFDVSSQYGPCIGISRMKRWYRAERLGLNPPVEVLAVLLKEEKKGTEGVETAHMDKILNSTAVEA